MAYDKVVDSAVLDAGLAQVANAIRAKTGQSGKLTFPTAMVEGINSIQAGGGVTYIMRGIIPEVASYIGDVEMEGE